MEGLKIVFLEEHPQGCTKQKERLVRRIDLEGVAFCRIRVIDAFFIEELKITLQFVISL